MFKFKIKRPRPLNENAMFHTWIASMDELARRIKADFDSTVATWEEKPEFTVTRLANALRIKITIATDDIIYFWVSQGTEPHEIEPIDSDGVMIFQENYAAKTSPNVIGSRVGGESGATIFSKHAFHPGIEPRNFDEAIKKKVTSTIRNYFDGVAVNVARVSGHSIRK